MDTALCPIDYTRLFDTNVLMNIAPLDKENESTAIISIKCPKCKIVYAISLKE